MSQREPAARQPIPFADDAAADHALGARVRSERTARGMTQADLAAAIGLGQDAVSRLERGERLFTLVTLARVEHALALPFGFFGRAVGLVTRELSVRAALAADDALPLAARDALVALYDYLTGGS
jgi:transcriptional regulator with XRE-family HTH domain